jgi:hypothetical protein
MFRSLLEKDICHTVRKVMQAGARAGLMHFRPEGTGIQLDAVLFTLIESCATASMMHTKS